MSKIFWFTVMFNVELEFDVLHYDLIDGIKYYLESMLFTSSSSSVDIVSYILPFINDKVRFESVLHL